MTRPYVLTIADDPEGGRSVRMQFELAPLGNRMHAFYRADGTGVVTEADSKVVVERFAHEIPAGELSLAPFALDGAIFGHFVRVINIGFSDPFLVAGGPECTTAVGVAYRTGSERELMRLLRTAASALADDGLADGRRCALVIYSEFTTRTGKVISAVATAPHARFHLPSSTANAPKTPPALVAVANMALQFNVPVGYDLGYDKHGSLGRLSASRRDAAARPIYWGLLAENKGVARDAMRDRRMLVEWLQRQGFTPDALGIRIESIA